jgi:hypothetical protein
MAQSGQHNGAHQSAIAPIKPLQGKRADAGGKTLIQALRLARHLRQNGSGCEAHGKTGHHFGRLLFLGGALGPEGHVITPVVVRRGIMIRALAPWRAEPYMSPIRG